MKKSQKFYSKFFICMYLAVGVAAVFGAKAILGSKTTNNAVASLPQSAETYISKAREYRESGNLDAAIQMLDLAAQQESGNPAIYMELGTTYQQQGLRAESASAYGRYLALAPNAADRADIEKIIKELQ